MQLLSFTSSAKTIQATCISLYDNSLSLLGSNPTIKFFVSVSFDLSFVDVNFTFFPVTTSTSFKSVIPVKSSFVKFDVPFSISDNFIVFPSVGIAQ